jgi:hypothetical protein
MKRTLLLVSLIALFTGMAVGQYYYIPANINPYGNPGGINQNTEEPYGDGLMPGWTNIDPLNTSPTWTAVQTLPFTFQFNGANVSQYIVSNTGVLTFTTTASTPPGTSNDVLPNAGIPDKSICVWGISYSGGPNCNDRIVTKTFGTAPNRQHWIQFNTYNIPGPNTQWCYVYYSIVLEETTNNIYVVDQRCSDKMGCQPTLTIGIQINSTSGLMVTGSPNLGTKAGTSKTTVDNRYYTFVKGSPPTRDLGVSWLQMSNFVILNAGPFDVKGKVKNYTGNQVLDYDINYNVNNGPVKTCHLSGAAYNIPGYGEEWFIHDSIWSPPDTGIFHFKYWASNINGGVDENHSNDTMYKTVEVSYAFTPKLRLFEEFTSSSCIPCKDGNLTLKSVLDLFPNDYALIKYPMNYPDAGDPYYNADCGVRLTYYEVDSLPDMYVNGVVPVDPIYVDTNQYNELWDKSFMMINATHTISGNTVSASASILPFDNFTQGTLVVRFAVVEKTTTGNVGANGETIFYNTFKKLIPDPAGVNLGQLQKAVFKTVARSYTFPTPNNIENTNNLMVIVFVQDDATKKVMQTAISALTSSIDDQEAAKHILKIFPNPASETTTVQYLATDPGTMTLDLLTATGTIVQSVTRNIPGQGIYQYDFNIDKLASGLYFVRLSDGTRSEISKLLVQ